MEEEKDMLPMSPFWLPNGQRRRLRRSYSLLLTSTSLLVTALAFIFIVVPTLHSFASHIFKPHSVKRSWDYLNLLLVLFAIVCGFLSKNNTSTETQTETPRSYQHRRSSFSSNASFNRLRSFNSYPDLRQESPWVAADERWRFYDDTHLLRHWRPRPEEEEEEEEEELGVETIATITSVEIATAPPQPPPTPSPPPPVTRAKAVRRNAKRTYQAEVIEKPESNDLSTDNLQPQTSTPPPPPRPAPLLLPLPAERKTVQGKKKRGIATKEFLTSWREKKKKQRHRSVENFDTILNSEPFPLPSQPPPSAPPPPPPPPPSVFHNLFSSKKGKHKKRHLATVATHKPHLSNKREPSYSLKDNVIITGNESPLIPIPPPPPPFKMPAWKFRVQGDFVRIDSIGSSSRSGSPDLDEVVDSPTSEGASQCNSPSAPDGGGGEPASATSLFCPSPDVDTKAHTFIERFRTGLRMEKMNSMKEKQGIGRSNLGPSPNPDPKEETRPSS